MGNHSPVILTEFYATLIALQFVMRVVCVRILPPPVLFLLEKAKEKKRAERRNSPVILTALYAT
jgi:hypothetical protein